MIINIHATISDNSIGYYRYMRANYDALKSGSHDIRYHAYCLDEASAARLLQERDLATVTALPFGRGSSGHAQAIETALASGPRGQINVIADTDVVLFQGGWDNMIATAMTTGPKYGIIGTRLEDIGGFSSGDIKHQQYKKKPTTTWMALSPDYDFSTLQVRPDKANEIPVTTQELVDLYNLPMGFIVVKDTGWQIPAYLAEHRIPYFAFDIVKPTSPQAKALAGVSPYHDEFQWDGIPFLAHQRGSMTHRFRIDPLSVDFYDACDRFLGHPGWSVKPNGSDLAWAQAQNIGRFGKKLIKKAIGRR